jgi:hypothetical protein
MRQVLGIYFWVFPFWERGLGGAAILFSLSCRRPLGDGVAEEKFDERQRSVAPQFQAEDQT